MEIFGQNFSCSTCKHYMYEIRKYDAAKTKWPNDPGRWPYDYHDNQCLHPKLRWPDRDCDGEEYLMPDPDFFCAYWENSQNGAMVPKIVQIGDNGPLAKTARNQLSKGLVAQHYSPSSNETFNEFDDTEISVIMDWMGCHHDAVMVWSKSDSLTPLSSPAHSPTSES